MPVSAEDASDLPELHYVDTEDALIEHTSILTEIDGVEIAVFHDSGDFYAVLNHCVHQGGPVCEGRIDGYLTAEQTDGEWDVVFNHDHRVIACPWHGWEFDVETGEHIALPQYSLPTYDVVVTDGDVYVRR